MNYAEQILASRYATALLRICGEQFSPDDLIAMQRAVEFFRSHKPALYFLSLPDLAVQEKKEIVHTLFEIVKLPACFHDLVLLLSRHKRLKLVAAVLSATLKLYQEQHNIMNVHIESSASLDEAQLKIIQEFL